MGAGGRTLVVILEGVLTFLYGAFQLSTLLILKTIKQKPKQTIPPTNNSLLLEPATKLAERIRRREITSKQVVQLFISRIEELNPLLNFLVDSRFAAAIQEAERVDEFLTSTDKTEEDLAEEKPFLGVPFTVKESFAVTGMRNTSGLHSREDIVAEEDAVVVSAVRDAGAIPLCVTNVPELCCWWETYNPLFGRTYNPYNTNFTPGGSSGGEGAVISAAGSLFGVGSDFAGSIRIPACFSGIFGHRPTSRATSAQGHYPIPSNDDLKDLLVSGPLCRYATDLRPLLKVMSKGGLNLEKPDLKTIKVYYLEECKDMFLGTKVQRPIKTAIRRAADHFSSLGLNVEKVELKGMRYAMMYWYAKIKTNDGPQLGKELANHKGSVGVASEFCKSLVGASKHTFPVILFGILEAGNGIPYRGSLHQAVLDEFDAFQKEIKTLLGDNGVLILPMHPTTALRHREAVARPFDIGYGAVFNVLGFPATSCPVGRDDQGLPVSIQVVANNGQDRLNLALAEEIENAFGGWTPPFAS